MLNVLPLGRWTEGWVSRKETVLIKAYWPCYYTGMLSPVILALEKVGVGNGFGGFPGGFPDSGVGGYRLF